MLNKKYFGSCMDGLSDYYREPISKEMLEIYYLAVSDMTEEDFKKAIRLYLEFDKNKLPKAADLKAMLCQSELNKAKEAAHLIWKAITIANWDQFEKAKAIMGELAWNVVQKEGGWSSVFKAANYDNKGILISQWRELALSILEKDKKGIEYSDLPKLYSTERKERLEQFKSIDMNNLLPDMP